MNFQAAASMIGPKKRNNILKKDIKKQNVDGKGLPIWVVLFLILLPLLTS
jgi:hypothetical protein